MNTLLNDWRYGLRMLAKNPGFTAVAVLTLALGIGANTAIFSVVNAALLRPLPYKDPCRLVYVWSAEKARGINQSTVSIPDLRDWRAQSRSFDGLAGWWGGTFNLSGGDEPQQVTAWVVSPDFFSVLGSGAELGRTFGLEDSKNQVIVLSHAFWRSSFGGDRNVLGKSITIDGAVNTVIGVMPSEFSSPFPEVQIWAPWPERAAATAARGDRFLHVIARLKPGANLRRAQAEMDAVTSRMTREYKDDAGVTAYLVPAVNQITGSVRPALLVLLGAVGFVLLIGCANLANLLLARSAGREREFAIRQALGAGHAALVRQLLTESLLLALLGGAAGALLAAWGTHDLKMIVAREIPRAQEIGVDAHVLWFTLVLSVLTGIGFGLFPAFAAFKGQFGEALKKGSRGAGVGVQSRRMRDLLVIWEMALAVILLVGAGLLISSFARLRAINPGFNPEKVLTCQISLPQSKYQDPQILAFFQQLLDRVRALPGVKAAGATMTLPLDNSGGFWGSLNIEGRAVATRESIPIVSFSQVTPGYLEAMGIPLIRGREFTEPDNSEQSPKVAIINATLARRFFSGLDPVGQRICMGENCSKGPWLTIVGVVGDAALQGLNDPRFPQVLSPHAQGVEGGPAGSMGVAIRTSSDPLSLAASVREQVRQLDRDQSVADLRTLDEVVSASLAQPRMNTLLLAVFATLALLLAAVGVYGVISYSVAQRVREIGIRMALGATRGKVLGMVVGEGLLLALAGLGLGLLTASGLARVMTSLLYGVTPNEPATFAAASVLLAAVAFLAAYIPARRATKVDPLVALRHE